MITKRLWAYAVAALVVIGGVAPTVSAQYKEEDLPTSSSAVDVWKLVCPSGTTQARANIYDLSAGDLLISDGVRFSVLVVKGSTGVTTLRHANDGNISSYATVAGGSGTYYVQIHKNLTTSTPVKYGSVMECTNSTGGYIPPSSWTLIQDR